MTSDDRRAYAEAHRALRKEGERLEHAKPNDDVDLGGES